MRTQRSSAFASLEGEVLAKLPEIREIGTKSNDKEFKALGIAIEKALEAPVVGKFEYPHDLRKSLNALIIKKDENQRALERSFLQKIKDKLMKWIKNPSLNLIEKTVVNLIVALIDAFKNNKFTQRVNLLFEKANMDAFQIMA